ncbi:MAG TPA: hypothetical protein VHY79_15665 [Rhizomicrobium sp.]|nr:hypothetical protein [Rhizomicrobium sp.]
MEFSLRWLPQPAQLYSKRRPFANQIYYSLVGRDYEWKLMPLGLGQGMGAVVWSPLGGTPDQRCAPPPSVSHRNVQASNDAGSTVDDEFLYRVVDALDAISQESGKTVPQIALNRPSPQADDPDRYHRSPTTQAA